MMTTPAICRFRKLGWALTANVKIAPMAIKARLVAVLICRSSSGDAPRATALPSAVSSTWPGHSQTLGRFPVASWVAASGLHGGDRDEAGGTLRSARSGFAGSKGRIGSSARRPEPRQTAPGTPDLRPGRAGPVRLPALAAVHHEVRQAQPGPA